MRSPIHGNPGPNADFERIVGPVAARTRPRRAAAISATRRSANSALRFIRSEIGFVRDRNAVVEQDLIVLGADFFARPQPLYPSITVDRLSTARGKSRDRPQ